MLVLLKLMKLKTTTYELGKRSKSKAVSIHYMELRYNHYHYVKDRKELYARNDYAQHLQAVIVCMLNTLYRAQADSIKCTHLSLVPQ